MAAHIDARITSEKQAVLAAKCHFPARELREYRLFLSQKADQASSRDLNTEHLTEEVVLIDRLRRWHEENHDCLCWYTRDELEAQLRDARAVR